MNWEMVIAVTGLVVLMGQTGALVFFAGQSTQMLRDHDRRIVTLETASTANSRELDRIVGRMEA